MSYLLQISIGPVQGFLAAARKTRDLKAGSDLLVQMTRAAAGAVEKRGMLIFPPEVGLPAANLVVAEVAGDPAQAAAEARMAILATLLDGWDRARTGPELRRALAGDLDDSLARRQIAQFAEVGAVWVEIGPDGYGAARERLGMAAASRKALRDFLPSPGDEAGRPKSPLDPALDTVLPFDRRTLKLAAVPGQTLLKPREALDAVSLVQRVDANEFASTRHVANGELVSKLREIPAYVELRGLAAGLRTDALELLADPDDFEGLTTKIIAQREQVKRAMSEANESYRLHTYYAIVAADGDRMGQHLNTLPSAEAHRAFSRNLTDRFANQVDGIVERHHGALIYAGGDDVLAFLPMLQALPCVRELHNVFAAAMPPEGPTLSAGIAVVHVKEDLQDALAYARHLERLAKDRGRNRLAVGALARGGGPVEFDLEWTYIDRFQAILEAYREEELPRGYGYEIERLGEELRLLTAATSDEIAWPEVRRISKRKSPVVPEGLYAWVDTAAKVSAYGQMLRVGHFLTRTGEEK